MIPALEMRPCLAIVSRCQPLWWLRSEPPDGETGERDVPGVAGGDRWLNENVIGYGQDQELRNPKRKILKECLVHGCCIQVPRICVVYVRIYI